VKDHLISTFIDDELSLDEKIQFVQAVGRNSAFRDAALTLIEQERWLRSDVVPEHRLPQVRRPAARRFRFGARSRPAFAAAAAIFFAAVALLVHFGAESDVQTVSHRFVVYRPDAEQVALAGSFTGWEPLPLQRAGSSGYWELTLELPSGEHRFTYLTDGGRVFSDPTLPTRERDDFGGENSVLMVKTG